MADNKTKPSVAEAATKGIWLRFLLLIPLLAVLAIASYVYIQSVCSTQAVATIISPEELKGATAEVTFDKEGVVEVESLDVSSKGTYVVTLRAVADGTTSMKVGAETFNQFFSVQVYKGAIITGGINFSGWGAVFASMCVFLLACIALFISVLIRLQRKSWLGYEMVAAGGGLLYSLFQLVIVAVLVPLGGIATFGDLVRQFLSMNEWFVILSIIPMGVLLILVSISNISLIRHEGLRPVNLLGVTLFVVWALVHICWFTFSGLIFEHFGIRAMTMTEGIVYTAITYGESLLLSTIVCAWFASKRMPKNSLDYLIVLGCGIRKDGTPSPLLAGRVDKAYDFDAECVAAGSAPAMFVPSGGQGPDEVMSEAQSMSDYLVGKGVEPDRIVLEDRSTSTLQNMTYSRKVIEAHAGCDANDKSIGFSTTNYHVFRGYVCAHEAGMAVEGMGSKTRAYFWPNAFLREFVGLLAAQWKLIALVYVVITAFNLLAAHIYTVI